MDTVRAASSAFALHPVFFAVHENLCLHVPPQTRVFSLCLQRWDMFEQRAEKKICIYIDVFYEIYEFT